MLLRLVLPAYNRSIQGGTVVKWHKAEGDRVDYGDDLLDLQVDEIRITKTVKAADAGQWIAAMSRHPGAREGDAGGATEDYKVWTSKEAVVFLRVGSSDTGVLRRIHAREGASCRVGDLLAVLTTDEGEAWHGDDQGLADASLFRAVSDLVPFGPGE